MPISRIPDNGPAVRGASVRVARSIHNLTQAKLARLSKVDHARLFQIEHDLTEPTPEEWSRLWGVLSSSGRERTPRKS